MKQIRLSSLFLFAFTLLFTSAAAVAQSGSFSDRNVDYSFDLPDSKWKMTTKPSPTSPNVEYVFIDRNDGHLEIRKLTVGQTDVLSDVVRKEETGLQFRPGFVAGKEENFSGRLRGTVYNFEYVAAGKSMSGRFYYLRANPTTVYVLRFTGERDKLRSIRNHTDSIARTFAVNGL